MPRIALLLTVQILAISCRLHGQSSATAASRITRIGVLTELTWEDPNARVFLSSFQQGLQELGYTEDRNIHLETRIADRDPKRLSDAAAELARSTDVVVTSSSAAARRLMRRPRPSQS